MNTEAHELIAELNALTQVIDALAQLTRQEAEHLAHARVDALREMLNHKTELLSKASLQREAARKAAARVLGVTLISHARLATLVEDAALTLHDTSSPELHHELSEAWQNLMMTLDDLEQVQIMSERLARQGVSWIESCLEYLTEPSTGATNSTYTKHGKARGQTASFLRRQA